MKRTMCVLTLFLALSITVVGCARGPAPTATEVAAPGSLRVEGIMRNPDQLPLPIGSVCDQSTIDQSTGTVQATDTRIDTRGVDYSERAIVCHGQHVIGGGAPADFGRPVRPVTVDVPRIDHRRGAWW